MALTYQQTKLVKGTIPALREHGERITTIFYRNMLGDHPELNNYFNSVNQKNGRQPRALTSVILNFAANISHVYELIPKLERMCNKHCSLGIQPQHYEIVGKYLVAAFGEVLGPAMTPEIETAWTKAYWLLAKMLIGREQQMYKDFQKWSGWRKFRIDRKVQETADIMSFYLVPQDGKRLPSFMPGQYVSVQVHIASIGYLQSRQYSLSDAPRPDYYRITIKRDPGMHFSNAVSTTYMNPGVVSNFLLDEKKAGDVIEVSHPAGEFFLDMNNLSSVPIVLISAGVGCTPLMSILNSIADFRSTRPVSWIHGARHAICFGEQIKSIARRYPGMKTNIFKTRLAENDLVGVTYDYDFRMDLSRVHPNDLYLSNGSTEYYISGSEQFLVEMADYLKSQGIDRSRVKFELFSTGDLEFRKPSTPSIHSQ
ncbi:putative globin-like protein [Zalerion maritima]|uniref:nitric oxide dioxygenase n=1 Tax=Zalerion maritima TaxID=339359 RepID=A0AAD5RIY7_9PEZI|nr:putative globin-like protein [Zalerion maritima]